LDAAVADDAATAKASRVDTDLAPAVAAGHTAAVAADLAASNAAWIQLLQLESCCCYCYFCSWMLLLLMILQLQKESRTQTSLLPMLVIIQMMLLYTSCRYC
jgi:hypothetical protein